ncbi:MAG: site-specific integrase [Candidatus Nitrosocaldus sp.]|nr:site-specific integrase [Candidatus Nitrosocaldus sp.]MDW8000133.1 site-specific integrase [Candidatus Nitrosocaldus sp.]
MSVYGDSSVDNIKRNRRNSDNISKINISSSGSTNDIGSDTGEETMPTTETKTNTNVKTSIKTNIKTKIDTKTDTSTTAAGAIYNYRKIIDLWLRKVSELQLQPSTSNPYNKGNKETVTAFINALLIHGIGEGRVKDYAQFCYRIHVIMHDLHIEKPLADLTREDVDKIAGVMINGKGWSYSTIAIALRTLKRLVHYAKHKEIAEGEGSYCEEVRHIHPDRYKSKAMKEEKVKATDLLTREEFLRLVETVPRISRYPARDRALLYVMYEFAARPSELLNMRVGNVIFHEGYAEITTTGKTGTKTLTVVMSYNALREWLEQHPLKNDPDAYLWYSRIRGRISYGRLREFVKRLAVEAGISPRKRVWLYLIRHTALTHVEKQFGSSITEIYGNWRKGSPVRNRYIHLATSDQREAVLRKYGLLKKEEDNNSNNSSSSSIVEMKRCYRCSNLNEPTARICRYCGLILDQRYALQLKNERDQKIKELEDRLARITEIVEELLQRNPPY